MRRIKRDLLQKINGGQTCQMVGCMASLGIADALRGGPKSLDGLATELQLCSQSLGRLLRALEALRLIERSDQDTYSLTEEGALLASDAPDSLQPLAVYKSAPFIWKAAGGMAEAVRSGKAAFEIVHGTDLFAHMQSHPEDFAVFQDAMACYEQQSSQQILAQFDFSQVNELVDIGGGTGGFLFSLLRRYRHMTGRLFDLPHVIDMARDVLSDDLAERVSLEPGDFFEQVPKAADAYLLRNILHDWDDKRCKLILNKISQAMRADSRLLVFEALVQPERRLGAFSDVTMMLLTPGGRERSLAELKGLFQESGLSLDAVHESTAAKSMLVVSKG